MNSHAYMCMCVSSWVSGGVCGGGGGRRCKWSLMDLFVYLGVWMWFCCLTFIHPIFIASIITACHRPYSSYFVFNSIIAHQQNYWIYGQETTWNYKKERKLPYQILKITQLYVTSVDSFLWYIHICMCCWFVLFWFIFLFLWKIYI